MTTAEQPQSSYPVHLSIDYAGTDRNRLTTFFRLVIAIPILIVIMAIDYGSRWGLFFPVLLMIVFRRKYPQWWFDFNVQLLRLTTRVGLYMSLLTDEYPSTDEDQSVHLEIDYPDAAQLNRFLPLVKWILVIPHYVVLVVLSIIALVAIVVCWFAIVFAGKFPRGFHDYIVGVTRWNLRVTSYAFLLTTDVYPPFSLK